jgi:hypothetical protein
MGHAKPDAVFIYDARHFAGLRPMSPGGDLYRRHDESYGSRYVARLQVKRILLTCHLDGLALPTVQRISTTGPATAA